MAEVFVWVLIGVAVLLVLAAVLKGKKKHEPDYKAFFYMGLVWTALGALSWLFYSDGYSALLPMGVVFLLVGLANRSKWKKKRPPLDRNMKIVVVLLAVLVMLGVLAAFLMV